MLFLFSCRLNSRVEIDAITEAISHLNAASLLRDYDVILDCTDNAPTRYLLSDTAVLLRKLLVSGTAQKYHGQLCTYRLGENGSAASGSAQESLHVQLAARAKKGREESVTLITCSSVAASRSVYVARYSPSMASFTTPYPE